MTGALAEHITVSVRVRAHHAQERVCLECDNSDGRNQVQIKRDRRLFAFDHVFDGNTMQQEIFTQCVDPLLQKYFKGFNAAVIVYGQTGSGKTYTMVGDKDIGIVPRVLSHIFDQTRDTRNSDFVFNVAVSAIEIYNEVVTDLIVDNGRALDLRWDTESNSVVVVGLTELSVASKQNALEVMERATKGRMVAETTMNSVSSRSHMVMTVKLKQQRKNDKTGLTEKVSILHMVDLAGSERVSKTGADKERATEGAYINQSLSTLGNVINAIAMKKKHVPFRDSKLTRLLENAIGGNSFTTLIATVSATDANCNESISTLRFADRAKAIVCKAKVNQDAAGAEMEALQNQVHGLIEAFTNLERENARLKQKAQCREKNVQTEPWEAEPVVTKTCVIM